MNKLTWLTNSFFEEKDHWILWTPIIFAGGIIFYFSYPSDSSYTFPFLLFCSSTALAILLRKELLFLIAIFITLFSGGFLWAKIYSEIIVYTPQITHPLYVNAVGNIDSVIPYENYSNHKISNHLTLKNVQFYKIDYNKEPVKEKKIKPKKLKKKPHKKRKYKARTHKNHASTTIKKKNSKTIIRNYLNLASYQDIDRELQYLMNAYPKGEWNGNKFAHPPQKISVTTDHNNLQIGDLVLVRVFLEPYKKPDILNGYDFKQDAYFKGIGAHGKATSKVTILKATRVNDFNEYINNLRQKIVGKISANMGQDQAGIAIALTVGYQDYISKSLMNDIRYSGLTHLLSISGLHLTLAFGIFFFILRFFLSWVNYLALNYDIKKIAAATAIFAGLAYLMLSGAPVPAVRSFIMVGLIFLAILFDQNPNPLRSIAFAAFAILFLSPDSILSISFQLSFAAILSLITLYGFISKSSSKPVYIKFIGYFAGIIFSSIAAEIAITPLSIYHFNNYVQYGMIANLIAIPITSFLIMPLVFLSLFLMPLGLEKLALYPMQFPINWIIKIASEVTNLPYSHHTIKMISPISLGLMIIGTLWFCIWRKNWRWLGILPIILGIYLAYKNPLPDLLIDGDKKYFAIYNPNQDELIFSKKLRESSQIRGWMKKMGVNNYRMIPNLTAEELINKKIFCSKEYCKLELYNHNILILTARNKINFICEDNAKIIINLTRYKLPECSKERIVIDNYDLYKNGGYFLYLQENQMTIKTVDGNVQKMVQKI